jgi:hypothetical protein
MIDTSPILLAHMAVVGIPGMGQIYNLKRLALLGKTGLVHPFIFPHSKCSFSVDILIIQEKAGKIKSFFKNSF